MSGSVELEANPGGAWRSRPFGPNEAAAGVEPDVVRGGLTAFVIDEPNLAPGLTFAPGGGFRASRRSIYGLAFTLGGAVAMSFPQASRKDWQWSLLSWRRSKARVANVSLSWVLLLSSTPTLAVMSAFTGVKLTVVLLPSFECLDIMNADEERSENAAGDRLESGRFEVWDRLPISRRHVALGTYGNNTAPVGIPVLETQRKVG